MKESMHKKLDKKLTKLATKLASLVEDLHDIHAMAILACEKNQESEAKKVTKKRGKKK